MSVRPSPASIAVTVAFWLVVGATLPPLFITMLTAAPPLTPNSADGVCWTVSSPIASIGTSVAGMPMIAVWFMTVSP